MKRSNIDRLASAIAGEDYIRLPIDPWSVEINEGDRFAVHLVFKKAAAKYDTRLSMVVVGPHPRGPRNGVCGVWKEGRCVAVGAFGCQWIQRFIEVLEERGLSRVRYDEYQPKAKRKEQANEQSA